jgi:hypothetical protein
MLNEKDLNNVPLEDDLKRNSSRTNQTAVPCLENDSYQAWWYHATQGWPTEARAEKTSTVVSEEGRLYIIGADGQVTRALEQDLRDMTAPLHVPAVIRPRFHRTSDGHLGAVER